LARQPSASEALAAQYFWRDNPGLAVDLVFQQNQHLQAIECKSGVTYRANGMSAALV
jgi:hypothetical protein